MAEEGFAVNDEVTIEDLSDVKEEKALVPPAKDVKFRISKAELGKNESGVWRWVALTLQIVDGIPVVDKETGGTKMGYINKPMFQNVCYFADPSSYTGDWFTKKQHLVQLKYLAQSVGLDITGLKVNDEFLNQLRNKVISARIIQSPDTVKETDPVTGQTKRVKTGDMSNEVKDFKAISEEAQV